MLDFKPKNKKLSATMFESIHTLTSNAMHHGLDFFTTIKAVPVDLPTVNEVANIGSNTAPTNLDLSIISLFMQAGLLVKGVMLFLLVCSVWSWTIIFDKWSMFKGVWSKTKNFEKNFWSGQPLEDLYERTRGKENHPMALVFSAAMQEWQARNARELSESHQLKVGTKERLYQSMQVAVNRSIDSLESSLSLLATVGSTAPFIGLFGTVWGIMNSFRSIAATKSTSLAVVAPGFAEALLATALGLAAAIPAVFFYNKFSNDLNRLSLLLEDFASELGSIITKELDSLK